MAQETLPFSRRRRAPAPRQPPAAMDSGTGSSGREPQRRTWADVPPDMLGIVVRRLPRVEDRARLRSVCGAWRPAARLHQPPPPPLPLLVLSDFAFSSFSPDGTMSGTRRIPLPEGVAAHDVRCVGSFEGWLAGVRPNKGRYFGDGKCFLMNASQIIETHRTGADVAKGDDAGKKSIELLEELGLPKGLFSLDDIVEFGYNHANGFMWIVQKKKKEHTFKKIKQTASYAGEVTAFVEKGRLKKVTGVKTKELFLWLSLVEVYVEESSPGKVTFNFKTGTGLSETFDAAAFALGE